MKREIVCALVGPASLLRFLGDRIAPEVHAARWSPGGDYHAAACYATRIVGLDTRACVEYVGARIELATRLVVRWWPRIVAVATALVAERTLSGARVRELVRAARCEGQGDGTFLVHVSAVPAAREKRKREGRQSESANLHIQKGAAR